MLSNSSSINCIACSPLYGKHLCIFFLLSNIGRNIGDKKGRTTSIEMEYNISNKLNFPLKNLSFSTEMCKKRDYVIPWILSLRHADLAVSKCEETPGILGKSL